MKTSNEEQNLTSPKVRWSRIATTAGLGFTLIAVISIVGTFIYNNWLLSNQYWCVDVDDNGKIVNDKVMFGDECDEPDLQEAI